LRLAIALGWHSLAYRELLDLVRRAESAGFEAAFVDGDVSQIPGLRGEFRRLNPWLRTLPDDQLGEAIVAGSPEACRRRISEIAESFRLDLPVADLSGLSHDATRRAIDALVSREGLVDSNTG
jgi:alkanesulfonate monooxygenase SsuD/methylene tetrahydromethanopterin reductase-like flavin-dependent oxidoreductase (luciferase family)